ncbi:hypothetical protein VTP01DRAFT_2009 [Rhizomucor pusillus]|uniref:uncharacterized protein n=1 Tax=Rhizomucor pusillus TaxID=4840 RepID=UPI0037427CFA
MEVSPWHLWLFVVGMATLFLAGLAWCFCCGTCIGQSLLRETCLSKFLPTKYRKRNHWRDHAPPADIAALLDDQDDDDDKYDLDTVP